MGITYRKDATITFDARLSYDGSWGGRDLGRHECTMELWLPNEFVADHGVIEWEIPSLEEVEHIGLMFDSDGNLTDYDGITGYLPQEAAQLLRRQGFKVDPEFTGD